jgi:hypothetical protein
LAGALGAKRLSGLRRLAGYVTVRRLIKLMSAKRMENNVWNNPGWKNSITTNRK